jgi:hypothetical protein
MSSLTLILPILPGKLEAVRQACALAFDVRRSEYEQSRRRLGITRETLWLAGSGDYLFWLVEAGDLGGLWPRLGASELAFDHWLLRHIREAHGVDLARWPPASGAQVEPLFTWQRE